MEEDLKNKEALQKEIEDLYTRVEKKLERLYKIKPTPYKRISKGEDIKNDLRWIRMNDFSNDKANVGRLQYWIKRLNDKGVFLKTPLE